MMNEFHSSIDAYKNSENLLKYELSPNVQKTFCDGVVSLKRNTSHCGNPFRRVDEYVLRPISNV